MPDGWIESGAVAVYGGVVADAVANPHEDTRGVVRQSFDPCAVEVEGVLLLLSRSDEGIRIDMELPEAAFVYGLGEKTGTLDKRGRTWTFWNSDDPLHTPDKDPLYQSIPVAYLRQSLKTSVVFSDSPATQYFDVGESNPRSLRLEIYDQSVDLYLLTAPALPDAVRAYSRLTGTMPLPPEWALGFQQCRYSYFPDARVEEVAAKLRELKIPCDVIYLDIHYMDGYRVFTWDPERFPDPRRMIERLHRQGFRVVTIVDPGVKTDPDYHAFAEASARDLFLEASNGEPYVGEVWPGAAAFPDFSSGKTRTWWAEAHRALFEPGVDGIWNDMNEPSDFTGDPLVPTAFTVPDQSRARNDGSPSIMGRLHNAYASGMNQATREAFANLRPESRGFVLTRAGYAGIQRHAAVWTGDNHSWWEHLAMQIPMLLNLSLSGVPFCGSDTGGFQFNASPELFARWVESACLLPFFRAHSALDTVDHEPWSFGEEVLQITRAHVELRYTLMPYLYTVFELASRTGEPIVRPLVYEFPDEPGVENRADLFLAGPSLLVAPVREAGVRARAVYLPHGIWYDYWSGARVDGGKAIIVDAPLERLPLFVRGGSIIPAEIVRQHAADPGDGVVNLIVAPDEHGSAAGELYGDAGEGFDYKDGELYRARFTYTNGAVGGERAEGASRFSRWERFRLHLLGSDPAVVNQDHPGLQPLP